MTEMKKNNSSGWLDIYSPFQSCLKCCKGFDRGRFANEWKNEELEHERNHRIQGERHGACDENASIFFREGENMEDLSKIWIVCDKAKLPGTHRHLRPV